MAIWEYTSGCVLVTVAHQSGLDLATATVRCPPRGPAFPNAPALGEKLLTPITEAIVYGRVGPRAIRDFNQTMHGWVELYDLMFQLHRMEPTPHMQTT